MFTTRTLLVATVLALAGCSSAPEKPVFSLTSPNISEGMPMSLKEEFNGFDAHGENLSPALNWSNVPAGTKSFAVTVYDPDAPTGSGWWHWVVVNIPAGTTSLERGAGTNAALRPSGAVQIRNDYGIFDFGGACPPKGDPAHHYRFTVFALDVDKLLLPENPSPALVGFMLRSHTLAKAQITALYAR